MDHDGRLGLSTWIMDSDNPLDRHVFFLQTSGVSFLLFMRRLQMRNVFRVLGLCVTSNDNYHGCLKQVLFFCFQYEERKKRKAESLSSPPNWSSLPRGQPPHFTPLLSQDTRLHHLLFVSDSDAIDNHDGKEHGGENMLGNSLSTIPDWFVTIGYVVCLLLVYILSFYRNICIQRTTLNMLKRDYEIDRPACRRSKA